MGKDKTIFIKCPINDYKCPYFIQQDKSCKHPHPENCEEYKSFWEFWDNDEDGI